MSCLFFFIVLVISPNSYQSSLLILTYFNASNLFNLFSTLIFSKYSTNFYSKLSSFEPISYFKLSKLSFLTLTIATKWFFLLSPYTNISSKFLLHF